ncbi:hypothetical protein AC481_06975 [miscellaneous Crenarchaeota group archaeon SMTZ-80]|nr:MAG: hypothetical protein AC481_06975 [miscellaneous Crenarchaeota group archaeon SMTZ-80]
MFLIANRIAMTYGEKADFYIPNNESLPLNINDLSNWYKNLLSEISQGSYTNEELTLLKDKHNYYGKYFNEGTREFFLNHFAKNLKKAINYFFGNNKSQVRFLEIGSGCGNQLLLTAFLGAEVVGCDIKKEVCDLVKKRKEFYEKISKRKLNISLICEDVFKIDWDTFPKFDAVNFLFSFNDIQPNQKMLELVNQLLKPGGRAVFQETNQSNYYNRLFRKRDSMTLQQVAKNLKKYKFKISSLRGGYALPPIFWRFLPSNILSPLDHFLSASLFLSPSYQLMAEKV